MKTIYKYPLHIIDAQQVFMPEGAEILTVQVKQGNPFLWAMVDAKSLGDVQNWENRDIVMFGTGNEIQPTPDDVEMKYIGTIQMPEYAGTNEYVTKMLGPAFTPEETVHIWHVFEIIKKEGATSV